MTDIEQIAKEAKEYAESTGLVPFFDVYNDTIEVVPCRTGTKVPKAVLKDADYFDEWIREWVAEDDAVARYYRKYDLEADEMLGV